MALEDIYRAAQNLYGGKWSPVAGYRPQPQAGQSAPATQGGQGTHIRPANIGGRVHTAVLEQNPMLMKYGPIDAQQMYGGFGPMGGAKFSNLLQRWGQPVFPYQWPMAKRETRMYKYKW